VVICYIFPNLECLDLEKSGNPDLVTLYGSNSFFLPLNASFLSKAINDIYSAAAKPFCTQRNKKRGGGVSQGKLFLFIRYRSAKFVRLSKVLLPFLSTESIFAGGDFHIRRL
jgi:hypothetical protein